MGNGDARNTELGALAPVAGRLRLAGLALLWERLWPRLVAPLAIAALFLAAVWLRILVALPDWARLSLVAVFVLAFVASLVPLVRMPRARPGEALARLERDSGFDHRPLTGLVDAQAAGDGDPVAVALWQAHKRRLMAAVSGARVDLPSPRVDRRDPYALRFVAVLLLVVGVVAGRGDYAGPLADALRLPSTPGPEVRVDAWVTPPGYTGRAPIFLTTAPEAAPGARPAPAAALAHEGPVGVPQGSVVSLRVNGVPAPVARFLAEGTADDAAVPIAPSAPQQAAAAPAVAGDAALIRPTGFQTTLDRSGTVVLAGEGGELQRFAFTVEPDAPPAIKLIEDPGATMRGAFRLAYEVTDDYRVAGARAVFTDPRTPIAATTEAAPRPLVGPPDMPLSLPRKTAAKKTAETFRDLSAHPWAGGTVTLTLEARDDAGNVGKSEPVAVVIPARPFRNPVARMLVEQRRDLALDANAARTVADRLDTVLTYSPEFIDDASVHLGLRTIWNRIVAARDDEDLKPVLDLMWQMALAIDGGDASLAEQRLREARERLREALQNGASKEEIAKLTEELRQAMQEYMQALQEQMQRNPDLAQQQPQQQNQNAQEVTPEDFQKMIDRIEELSKLGDREAAEQLLSQLDQMLENLQMAQPSQGQQQNGQQQSQGQQMMNELADMIRRQQELMNQTHKMTPDGRPQDGQGMSEQQMQDALKQLQQGQADLEKRLGELMQQMEKNGMQPGDQLGQAQGSMKGAQGSLGEGETGQALGQQGQALDQLRQGAQQLAQQMGDQEGQQQGQGQGRRGQSAQGEDPLGRPQRRDGPDFGDSVKVPGEIEVQKARRILEELRRRFSDPQRPAIELDYLQRLLNPF